MSDRYRVHCDCGAVELEMSGAPRVHAFCHWEDCRALLDVPFQLLIRKCNHDTLPEALRSDAHFYYDRRIVDIDDRLPKS
jgi:hypothetical protein